MMNRIAWIAAAVSLFAVMVIVGPMAIGNAADAAKVELHILPTVTLTDVQFLTGVRRGTPATIAGELRIPHRGNDRLPAMVLVHGSGGILSNEDHWAREFNDMGVATFMLDGFTGRGISSAAADQEQLGMLTMINDAYRALDLLAKHPRIDAERIGILGGSRGGRVALYASLKRFQRSYGTPGLEFALYLPLYAPCYTKYIDDEQVTKKPIRMFHGAADEAVPIAACKAYVNRLRAAGADVELMELPNAHHLFDNPLEPLRKAANGQTFRRCHLEERVAGQVLNVETDSPFTFNDACIERGYTLGYDSQAHAQVLSEVRAFVKRAFHLQ